MTGWAEGQKTLDALRRSREALLGVVAGVSEEQFKRRPTQDEDTPQWSIAEVLAHLLASEQRLGAVLSGATLHPVEARDRNEEARLGRTVPVPQVIHGLLAARRHIEISLEAKKATITAETLDLVRREIIEHERGHTAQIEAIREGLGAARKTQA